jgi:hypothetical protein
MQSDIKSVLCMLAVISVAALVWFDYPKTKSRSVDMGLLLGVFESRSRSETVVTVSVVTFGLLSSFGKSIR